MKPNFPDIGAAVFCWWRHLESTSAWWWSTNGSRQSLAQSQAKVGCQSWCHTPPSLFFSIKYLIKAKLLREISCLTYRHNKNHIWNNMKGKLFDVVYDFDCLLKYGLVVPQPTTRGQLRCFGFIFGERQCRSSASSLLASFRHAHR